MQFFLDFDDTLVAGPVTWAINNVFPAMIQDHALPYSPAALDAAILAGQQQASTETDDAVLLDDLFRRMNWPDELKSYLFQQVFDNYQPGLFDDTLAFLQRLSQRTDSIYVLSNNNRSPDLAQVLGIAPYITAFFTPKRCGLSRGKPYRDIWDYIGERHTTDQAVLIGDDPWSDGTFAETCGIPCYIVDRMNRFGSITMNHRRVQTLNEALKAIEEQQRPL